MTRGQGGAPDPSVLTDIKNLLAVSKNWVADGEMQWVDAGGRPRGYSMRERLSLPDGSQPAKLFVQCYYKPAHIPGCADKVSFSLMYNDRRVFGVDDGQVEGHVNFVGVGRPFYLKRIGFPHVHTVSDDGIEGYAEPLAGASLEAHWEYFLRGANILGAPPFKLPPIQFGLPV